MLRIGPPLAMLCALTSVPALAADSYSWGKPGASRQDFEGGSRACILQATRRDVAGDTQTKRYVRGTDVLDRENNMPPMGNDDAFARSERQVLLRRAYAPDRQADSLQAQLQSEVDQCLVKAGYVRFALSREQARTLRRYRPGSEQRKTYLYTLGSDARIVAAQKVAD
ncbi:hypothetical protein [Sphingomonas fuzhouensis]|uniref:hypothetical protein n=1 Tax=Sphingomonas fuzhouensis TaxID=3106033 RepID=UPI002B001406|nr:hypothetical protein [Sphingomonas sp. SGZ-02]